MIEKERKQIAKLNFDKYLAEGLIKKEMNEVSKHMYLKNADLSLAVADELQRSELKPYLWVIVASYYSMFYVANAVLLELGYKTQHSIAHKVTADALIVLVLDKLQKGLIEEYEVIQKEALEIASVKADDIVSSFESELDKRSRFQYNMLEQTKEAKAQTSFKRATEFLLEMRKLVKLSK
jgi:uncharacterized protein (UPF0332 family)